MQLEVLRNPAVWVLGFSSAMMYVARYGVNNWGVLVLQEGKGHSMMDAGTILAIYSVAGLSGSFLSGFISDRFFGARRNLPTFLFGLIQIASLVAMFLIPPGHFWLDVSALAVFGFAMGILVSFLGGLMAIDIVSPRAAGAAAGVVGMFSYIGAALQDAASGWLIDQGRTVTELPVDIRMERLSELCGAFGTDLSRLIGPDRCVGVRTVILKKVDYSFTDPFLFWIGASVLSMLLALAVWKAVDRARGRI
jgi:MFS transporter, OPA family, sugar phosphate sensor protein UhpC